MRGRENELWLFREAGAETGDRPAPGRCASFFPICNLFMSLAQFLRRIAANDRLGARRSPRSRGGFQAEPAAEVLESRALLSATGVRTVTAAENGQAVTVDATEFSSVVVEAGAEIGTLTINGDPSGACDIDVQILGSASSLNVQGGTGAETATIAAGGSVGTVTFQGDGGADRLTVEGEVTGSLTFNGDAGNDTLTVQGAGTVGGNLSGGVGAGADTFEVLGTATVDNVSFGLGAGDDIFNLLSTTATTGNFSLTAGEGADTLTFGAGTEVDGNESVDAGAGADTVDFQGHSVIGNQVVDLGDSAAGTDALTFGDGTIQGGSTVRWTGDVDVMETAARTIGSLYTFEGTDGDATADLTGGSDVAGDFSWTNSGATDLTVQMQIEQANFAVNTGTGAGTGADTVTVQDGTTVGGNFNATLGGSEADDDTLELLGTVMVGDPEAGVNGNMTVNLGGGEDSFTSEMLTLNGNQTINLGPAGDGGTDTVSLGDDVINGSSNINFGDGLMLTENGPREIASDYAITAQGGSGDVTADLTGGSAVGGNFSLTSFGPTTAMFEDFIVNMGNFNLQTGTGEGSGADDVTFSGTNNIGGNFEANLGGSEADADSFVQTGTLNVGDPETGVNGNFTLCMGGGNDTVSTADLNVNGNRNIKLGPGEGGTGPDGGGTNASTITLDGGMIAGDEIVEFSGDVVINQTGPRTVGGDYILRQTGVGSVDANLNDNNDVGGDFVIDTTGPTTVDAGFDRIGGDLIAMTGDSDDSVTFNADGAADGVADIGGEVNLDVGAGDDTFELTDANVRGRANLQAGTGGDTATLRDVTVGGNAGVNATGEGGSDTLDFENVQVGGILNALTGDADDTVTLEGVSADRLNARLNGGDDMLELTDGTFRGTLNLQAGAGGDTVTVRETSAGGNVGLNATGEGAADTVTFENVSAGNLMTILTGAGGDTVTLSGLSARRLNARVGAGDDTLEVTDSEFRGTANLQAGTGGDTVTVREVDAGGSVGVGATGEGGADTVTFDTVTAGSAIAIRTGSAGDTVDLAGTSARRYDVVLGAGGDMLTARDLTVRSGGRNANIQLGAGGDTATLRQATAVNSSIGVNAGAGDDTVDVGDSSSNRTFVVSTLGGADTILAEAIAGLPYVFSTGTGPATRGRGEFAGPQTFMG